MSLESETSCAVESMRVLVTSRPVDTTPSAAWIASSDVRNVPDENCASAALKSCGGVDITPTRGTGTRGGGGGSAISRYAL